MFLEPECARLRPEPAPKSETCCSCFVQEHPVRDSALAVAMGWHRRLGDASLLGGLDPHLLNRIMALSLEAPLRVPQDFATLTDAFEAAVDGQTVFVSRGVHSLVRGASGPTRLTKRLVVVGEPGAELHGGLQLGFESAGVLKSLTIKGYLWVYDGKWQVENCSITNHNDAVTTPPPPADVPPFVPADVGPGLSTPMSNRFVGDCAHDWARACRDWWGAGSASWLRMARVFAWRSARSGGALHSAHRMASLHTATRGFRRGTRTFRTAARRSSLAGAAARRCATATSRTARAHSPSYAPAPPASPSTFPGVNSSAAAG